MIENFGENKDVILRNVTGNEIIKVKTSGGEMQINLENLSPGFYYLQSENKRAVKILKL